MDLALYHPEFGYYARAAQRSGRAGDFFTSVDLGPVFGELLALQIAEMARMLALDRGSPAAFDIVEAGAGNGRLSTDIVRALAAHDPAVFNRTRLHLVEASSTARAAHADVLGAYSARLTTSSECLPDRFAGVL